MLTRLNPYKRSRVQGSNHSLQRQPVLWVIGHINNTIRVGRCIAGNMSLHSTRMRHGPQRRGLFYSHSGSHRKPMASLRLSWVLNATCLKLGSDSVLLKTALVQRLRGVFECGEDPHDWSDLWLVRSITCVAKYVREFAHRHEEYESAHPACGSSPRLAKRERCRLQICDTCHDYLLMMMILSFSFEKSTPYFIIVAQDLFSLKEIFDEHTSFPYICHRVILIRYR